MESGESSNDHFAGHRKPLVAHFRGRTTGIEFKLMVNHLAGGNASARLAQADFLNDWVRSESMPIIAVGDYNFDFHVEFGDSGDRDPGFDAMIRDDQWIWVRPETLIKTQASDKFMSVLDFVFVAHPLPQITGTSTILERDGDQAAVDLDFDDSNDDTDHRPVAALFTIGGAGPAIEDIGDEDPVASFDRSVVLERIRRGRDGSS